MKISIELDASNNVTALQVDGRDHNVVARSTLPPGQVIADVGSLEGTYTGTLDPGTLTREEWAYWAQHPELWAKQGQILSRPAFVGVESTGYIYTVGDLATATPDGSRLSQFV